ncbi:MAG: hypothetical protein ACLFPX_08390 [Candidatus Omnitrophota bacterium]
MTRGILGVIKFAVFILIFPAVVGVIIGFEHALSEAKDLTDPFWWGVIAYTLFHLFVYTPQPLFQFVRGVFAEIFAFSPFLSEMVPLIIPLATTLLLLVVFLLHALLGWTVRPVWVVGLTGFFFAMHVILTAQELYEHDESHLKGHYLFGMGVVFMFNMLVLALLMDLNFLKFDAAKFLFVTWETLKDTYAFLAQRLGL